MLGLLLLTLCHLSHGQFVALSSHQEPQKDGQFQILNFRADPALHTVCLRFQSYHFNTADVNVYQCLVSHGESCLMESIHGQSCNSTDSECSKGN